VEIGFTFLAPKFWGGTYNGEMKRLMLRHAYQWVESVVFLVGLDNARSKRSVEKTGAKLDVTRIDATSLDALLYRILKTNFHQHIHAQIPTSADYRH
jgi:RimJ/RimL family protein N-acetyltransferase